MDEDTRLQDRTYLAAPAESIAFEQVDAFVKVKQCITRTVPDGIRVLSGCSMSDNSKLQN